MAVTIFWEIEVHLAGNETLIKTECPLCGEVYLATRGKDLGEWLIEHTGCEEP